MTLLFKNENKFDKEILKVSLKEGVPFSVIKGIIAGESGFNEKAYREEPHIKDASYGLMQILYRTAKSVGFKDDPKSLFNPEINIEFGTKYLKSLYKKYRNIMDTISAYNQGFPRKAKDTTPFLIRLFGNPEKDWIYANQPYVDKIASYISYFQLREKGQNEQAEKILDLIKKKDLKTLKNIYPNLLSELIWI